MIQKNELQMEHYLILKKQLLRLDEQMISSEGTSYDLKVLKNSLNPANVIFPMKNVPGVG